MLNISHTYRVLENHPALAGHFPGNPVIPGVIILDYARELLENALPKTRIKSITTIKFMQPVFPEQEFCIHLKASDKNKVKFTCLCNEKKIIYGTFVIENKPL